MLLLFCSSISFSQNITALKASALRDAKITAEATLKWILKPFLNIHYQAY